jgi:hypothetical protein
MNFRVSRFYRGTRVGAGSEVTMFNSASRGIPTAFVDRSQGN